MTTRPQDPAAALTPIKRALLEIRELKARLAAAEGARREPIAIVGLGLRFPGGARDAESFARLLWSGTDAITAIPPERWSLDALYDPDPDAPGKMITRYGGFLEHVDQFDAEFFGISPREAASMDPQQRLVLEVAWEALEDSGHAPAALAGTSAGVYLGISNNDYGRALFADRRDIDPYFGSGNSASVAAGRLSYLLGLQGPSIAVDTACSSSLVAMHLACQGLRLGECDLALAGGVNLILTPEMNITFTKARMMAPDGRCKTFDSAADGYVRGEGCGFVVLRRLRDALADGDRVLAVVRGSAVNQDGRSGGLTAPNGPAQEAVIRAALDVAGVEPRAVGYVEAHGTGTSLGDPIEVNALGAVLSAQRDPAHPLAIGSVKTNLGHLEAAAGIAGVIKVVLSLQRKEIPPHLHFVTGNPHIDWAGLPVTVPTALTPWTPIAGRRLAGVSSFGFSGTNAHVILEEAPPASVARTSPDRPQHLLALSARDDDALSELARRYDARLEGETAAADVCFTANAGRSHLTHRLAVVGATAGDLRAGVAAYANGRPNAALATGTNEGMVRPQVAFLFTGQGAQSAGMGRLLYETSPVFHDALDACAAGLELHLDRGLLDVMFAGAESSPINETAYAQPATFALEYALAQLWRSWGIEPVAVLGHSLGEYAAACVAGLFSLEDGLRLVAERGRLTHALPANGAMAAVFANEDVVATEVARAGGALTIAAFNGPEHFVISGRQSEVEAALGRLEAAGIRVKPLRVPHAAHSPLIEPILDPFRRVLDTVRFDTPHLALVSNVTGSLAVYEEIARPDYWLTHMRAPVRFAQSMHTAKEQGITHFIEVGPHPVLLGMGAECLPGAAFEWLPSLRRDRPDWSDLLESLQRLYVGGAGVDWEGFDRGYSRRRVALPTYPFRSRRHWMEVVGQPPASAVSAVERWSAVTATLNQQAERGPLDLNVSSYPAKWDCLARITAAHAVRTLHDGGVFTRAGERHTVDEVLRAAGIDARYRHLVHRWLDQAVADGALAVDGDAYVASIPLPAPDLDALWDEAGRLFSDNRPVLDYVRHCGALVGPVLRGETSPLETLFPGGSFELAEGLYERSTTMRYMNSLAAAACAAMGAAIPAGRTLRVLEIGAGTGGTTSALLPALPKERTRYRCTDVSELFLERSRERFGGYSFVEFGLFDVDREPAAQGYAEAQFDLIVAANAVHACTDLRATLGHLRSLLAPGGILLLIESTTHFAWFDMTTGLIEGWQHFADDLRGDNPLLAPPVWMAALATAGFVDSGAWPRVDSAAAVLGQHVIVARAPGDETAGGRLLSAPQDVAVRPVAGDRAEADQDAFNSLLRDALPADRLDLLRGFVRERVMRVLRLDENDSPGRSERLMDLGFDSLMAVQLRGQLGAGLRLERPLPATLMFDYPTIDAIAEFLLARLAPAEQPAVAPTPAPAGKDTARAAEVAAMSEAEIEALLTDRFGHQ